MGVEKIFCSSQASWCRNALASRQENGPLYTQSNSLNYFGKPRIMSAIGALSMLKFRVAAPYSMGRCKVENEALLK